MPNPTELRYVFSRSERSIFTEIYFPKRAAYQGKIFDALRYGNDEKKVKRYLSRNIKALLEEFKGYPALLDPQEYTTETRRPTPPSLKEARRRINMYQSVFWGWSVYSVDGVFFSKRDSHVKMDEEATQVVRIMFRFESSSKIQAATTEAHCEDVLRATLLWVISQPGRLDDHKPWSEAEQAQFISRHQPWPEHKLAFAQQHFADIAKEVAQWADDRALFVFGYLVRKFWEQVIAEKMYEAEIWAASNFDQLLNVTPRVVLSGKPNP